MREKEITVEKLKQDLPTEGLSPGKVGKVNRALNVLQESKEKKKSNEVEKVTL